MTNKHTPGPFDTEEGKIIAAALTDYASRTVGRERFVAEQLAITAPIAISEAGDGDLLAALRKLTEQVDAGTSADYRALQEACAMRTARAAIAKAEGR